MDCSELLCCVWGHHRYLGNMTEVVVKAGVPKSVLLTHYGKETPFLRCHLYSKC